MSALSFICPAGVISVGYVKIGFAFGKLTTVLNSVAKTNRVVIVEEGPLIGGWGANLMGIIASEGLHDLDDAWTIACPETPIPYSPTLEDPFIPTEGEIARTVAARLGVAAEIATGA